MLRRRKFRLRTGDGWVSAEKGYRRELGNLLFHLALLALLGAVALGGLFGYKANRLLVSGTSFANTATALDEFHPGRLVSSADLQPFTITLNRFTASYVTSGQLRGQPSAFDAYVSYSAQPGVASPARRPPGQPPAEHRRRQGVPHRSREMRTMRAAAGLTATQLGKQICRSRADISRLENGHVVDQADA